MGDQAELNLLHMCCSPPRVCGTRGRLRHQELRFAFSCVRSDSLCTAVGVGRGRGCCACLRASLSRLSTRWRISCRHCWALRRASAPGTSTGIEARNDFFLA